MVAEPPGDFPVVQQFRKITPFDKRMKEISR